MVKGFCTICKRDTVLFGPRLNYEYHICNSCGTLQLFPMPDEHTLEAAYSEHYATAKQTVEFNEPDAWKAAGEPYRRDILNALIDHKVSGLVVDFGAGWGYLCEMLSDSGFNRRGVELSPEMASYAQQKGFPVYHGGFDLIKQWDDQSVSAIVLCAVFEHLTNYQMWMQRFNNVLPLGGKLVSLHPTSACYTLLGKIMRLGNRNKELPELHGSFAPPWHTTLISIQGMSILADLYGFEIIEIRPASQGRTPGVIGFIQRCLGIANWFGWRALGLRWPLVTTHVFVLNKVRNLDANSTAL